MSIENKEHIIIRFQLVELWPWSRSSRQRQQIRMSAQLLKFLLIPGPVKLRKLVARNLNNLTNTKKTGASLTSQCYAKRVHL